MEFKQKRQTGEAHGLGLLEEHEAAPEISQLLDYGQNTDDDEAFSPTAGDMRVARFSVLQTAVLSCLIAAVALVATYFALYRTPETAQPVTPSIEFPMESTHGTTPAITDDMAYTAGQNMTEEEAALIAATTQEPRHVNVNTIPAIPTKPAAGVMPLHSACTIEQILQGPAGKLISWHYENDNYEFRGKFVCAFESTYLIYAHTRSGSLRERVVAFTNDGDIRWEVHAGDYESITAIGGNDLYAFVGANNMLRAYNGWGELAWKKELPTEPLGEIVSDSCSRIYIQGRDGTVFCLGPHGHSVWTYKADAAFSASFKPLIDKRILCTTADGTLHCLDKQGKLLWRKELRIGATPVWGKDGSVFAGSGKDGLIYKLDTEGNIVWQTTSPVKGDYFNGSFIALDDGGVIAVYSHPNCVRYDAEGNARLLFKHTGAHLPAYRIDAKRFAIPDGFSGIAVYDIEGTYLYTFPISLSEEHGYMVDEAGNLYGAISRRRLVAVRPLP